MNDGVNFESAGSSTFVLTAPAGVDARQCESLARSPGITRAGALRDTRGSVTSLPLSGVSFKEVTPGFVSVISRGTSSYGSGEEGVLVTSDLADSLNVIPGSSLASTSGNLVVESVFDYPRDGRSRDLENALLGVIPPVGNFDECWIRIWPYSENASKLLRTAISASFPSDGNIVIRQLNAKNGERFEGADRFAGRPTKSAPVLALALAGVIAFAGMWTRRLSLASDRHAGVSRVAQLAQLVLESLFWSVPSAFAATAALRMSLPADSDSNFVSHYVERIGLAAVVGVVLVTAAGWIYVREKQIFVYFKGR